MAEYLRMPQVLSFSGDVSENWRIFEMEFDIFIGAAHSNKTAKEQTYILLNLAGREAMDRHRSFVYKPEILNANNEVVTPAEDKEDVTILKQKFSEICTPEVNVTIERHILRNRHQQPTETVVEYVGVLRNLVKTCGYGEAADEHVKDMIVSGNKNAHVQKVLLKEGSGLTLKKAMEISQVHELTEVRSAALSSSNNNQVDALNYNRGRGRQRHGSARGRGGSRPPGRYPPQYHTNPGASSADASSTEQCPNCGDEHAPGREDCKAFGKQCNYCHKWNHFQTMCRSRFTDTHDTYEAAPGPGAQRRTARQVYLVDDQQDDEDAPDEYFVIDTLGDNTRLNDLYATIRVNGQELALKVDTGARCNVLPLQVVNNLKKVEPTIHVSANCKRLTAYGGTKVATCGTTALTCNVQESRYTVTFEIVDGDVAPIIGCYDAIRLNLISFNQSTVHLINNNDDGTNTEFNADLVNTLSCPPPDDDNGNESDYHVKAPSQISLNKKEELRQAAASGTQLQQLETAAEDGIKLRQNKAIIPHALDSLPDKTLASMKRKRRFATDGSTNPQSNYGLAENAVKRRRDDTLSYQTQRLTSRATRTPITNCNKHASPRKPLETIQVVRNQTPSGFNRLGTVVSKCLQLRSYIVNDRGKNIRRHLLTVPEKLPQQQQQQPSVQHRY